MKYLNKAALIGAASFLVSSFAYGFNAQSFRFSHSYETVMIEDAIHTEHTHISKDNPWMFGVSYNYVRNPLIVISEDGDTFKESLIRNYQTWDFLFTRRMELTEKYIAHLQLRTTWNNVKVNGEELSSFGDTQIGMKVNLDQKENTAFALMPFIDLPTGDVDEFNGDDSLGVGILGTYEYHLVRSHFYFNLGYRYASEARFQNINLSSRVILGAAWVYDLDDKWSTNLEWKGEFGTSFDRDQNPSDILASIKHAVSPSVNLFAGGGVGGLNFDGDDNVDSNDFRILAGLKWSPVVPTKTVVKTKIVEKIVEKETKSVLKQKLLILKGVKFHLNKDTLTERSKVILELAADALKEFDKHITSVEVEGHTDSQGSAKYNLDLSQRRANTVVRFLVNQGIAAKKLRAVGYGEKRLKVSPEKGPEDYETNRRVEFKVKFKDDKRVLRSKD